MVIGGFCMKTDALSNEVGSFGHGEEEVGDSSDAWSVDVESEAS